MTPLPLSRVSSLARDKPEHKSCVNHCKTRGRNAFVIRKSLFGVLVRFCIFASSAVYAWAQQGCTRAYSGLDDCSTALLVRWCLRRGKCSRDQQGRARAHSAKRHIVTSWWHVVGECAQAQQSCAWARCLRIWIFNLLSQNLHFSLNDLQNAKAPKLTKYIRK